mgnify:CR=1 FL=1
MLMIINIKIISIYMVATIKIFIAHPKRPYEPSRIQSGKIVSTLLATLQEHRYGTYASPSERFALRAHSLAA